MAHDCSAPPRRQAASVLLLLACASLCCGRRVAAHVFWSSPPTRAACFYAAPVGDETDTLFRGNPCGRASRGVRGALVAGADSCVRLRMVVAHPSTFRVALAAGTAAASGADDGRVTAFDVPGAALATFACDSLPGGCGSAQGDYELPVVIPANTSAGVYTLQLRQRAPDLGQRYYYYDCADVLVVAALQDVPAALAGAAGAMARSCDASFTRVTYPVPIYSQSAVMFGSVGAAALIMLAADAAWVLLRHRAARAAAAAGAAAPKDGTAAPPADEEQVVPYTLTFSAAAAHAARQRWRVLAAQAVVITAAFAAMVAVNITWRECTADGGAFVPNS